MNQAYIGLGSNLGNTEHNLNVAIQKIGTEIGEILKISTFHNSAPWGFESESAFLNAVVKIQTTSNSLELLSKLQAIEKEMGRVKTKAGYEDRIIDLDILYFNDEVNDSSDLKLPHPHIKTRNFVYLPLLEIEPKIVCPVSKNPLKSDIEE